MSYHTQIILGHDQALDSLHGLRHALEGRAADNSTLPLPRLCMTLDKTQQQCFPLDASQFIFTNNIVPGCHSLVAHLEGTDIESDPIVFQVDWSSCQSLSLSALIQLIYLTAATPTHLF